MTFPPGGSGGAQPGPGAGGFPPLPPVDQPYRPSQTPPYQTSQPHQTSQPYGTSQPYQPYPAEPVDPYGGAAGYPVAPVPVAHQYVNPGSWEPAQYFGRPPGRGGDPVPGMLVGGTVVGYLLSLWVFVVGFFLVFFGTLIGSIDDLDSSVGGGGIALVVAGLGNWIAAALLVTGGILATLRRASGLLVTLAGAGVVVVLAVFWVVLYPSGDIVFWAVVHTVFGLLAGALVAAPPANRAWLARTPAPAAPGPIPPPYPTDAYGRPFGS